VKLLAGFPVNRGEGNPGRSNGGNAAPGEDGGTVYLIEPEPAVRRGLRAMLASYGYRVAAFASAEEFLAAPATRTGACLVVEAALPGMSGVELLERLARDGESIPAIVTSSRGRVSTAVGAMRAGAVDFLEKPFSPAKLVERVGEILSER
jgi:FixJ family two-component response regulator